MKNYAILVTMFITLFSANAQINSRGDAINKAGVQRMLCMKMAKNYMSIGSGVKTAEAIKELDEASAAFNENYNDLVVFAKFKETKDALTFVGVLWAKFRDKVNATPAIDDATSIIIEANNLANACNIVTEKMVINTASKTAVLPNICGKQRMYSQKLAMLYLAKYWQVSYSGMYKDLNETLANYESALATLTNSPENTEDISTILKLQQSEWNFTKKSFDLDNEKMSPASVYSSTNLMTRNFDNATKMYEKLVLN